MNNKAGQHPTESRFESSVIENHLKSIGFKSINHKRYNRELCLLPEKFLSFIKDSQPEKYQSLTEQFGSSTEENILKKFLDNKDSKTKPIFVNNYSWLKNLNYISFLRDIGKHFTINKMLSFDSIKTRLEREQSLSYMEFNYMILQAYDF